MAKPIINNYEDLMEEKARLKANLKRNKTRINESFEALKEELNPFTNVGKVAKSALQGNTNSPLVKFGIKRASEFLIGKVLLKRAGWLPKLVVPFIVREVTSKLVGHKMDKKIASTLRSAASAVRKTEIPKFQPKKKSKSKTL